MEKLLFIEPFATHVKDSFPLLNTSYSMVINYVRKFFSFQLKTCTNFHFLSNINLLSIETLKIDFQNDDHFFQYVLKCNRK